MRLKPLTIGVCACLSVSMYAAHSRATNDGGAQSMASGMASGFGEAVDRDLARVRSATARFKKADEALAAGYTRTDHCVERKPDGGMGLHWSHPQLHDVKLEVEKPEILVYEKLADGTYKLNGVEYVVPISAWTRAEPPEIMGQKLKRAEMLGIWYLHVWVWNENPSGVFADWNPRVKC